MTVFGFSFFLFQGFFMSKNMKRGDDVLRDIENLDCSEGFRALNFEPSSYLSKQNKELPKYYITQNGFSFLVMGYTGKLAAQYKESYIRDFNRMRDKLQLSSPTQDYLSMSDEDRAIAYFTKLKAEKELLSLAEEEG
jgi:Rha family phage regulatory protein